MAIKRIFFPHFFLFHVKENKGLQPAAHMKASSILKQPCWVFPGHVIHGDHVTYRSAARAVVWKRVDGCKAPAGRPTCPTWSPILPVADLSLVFPHSCGGCRRCCRGTRIIWSPRKTAINDGLGTFKRRNKKARENIQASFVPLLNTVTHWPGEEMVRPDLYRLSAEVQQAPGYISELSLSHMITNVNEVYVKVPVTFTSVFSVSPACFFELSKITLKEFYTSSICSVYSFTLYG